MSSNIKSSYLTEPHPVIIDVYERWKQYETDYRTGRIKHMEFTINLEELKEKLVSVFGTIEPFNNYIKLNNKQS